MGKMSNILDFIKYILGLDDLIINEDYENIPEQTYKNNLIEINRSNKVIPYIKKGDMHTNYELKIYKMYKYSDSTKIVDDLKRELPIILNLQDTDNEDKRKIIDFISGAVYALDANFEKICKDIFAITPKNVDIFSIKDKYISPFKK